MTREFKNENGLLCAEITFNSEEVKKAQEKAIDKLIQGVTVPGYRKGKAPKEAAISRLNQNQIINESIDKLLYWLDDNLNSDEEFKGYIRDRKFFDGLRPDVKLTAYDLNAAKFHVEWALNPVLSKLGAYTGLKNTATLKKITEKDVDEKIHQLAEDEAELVVKEKAAELGDICNIDFTGLLNGEPFDGGSAKGYDLELGSNKFVPGFEEQVVSHVAGDKFDVELTLPDNYPEPLNSKHVIFKVTLNSVETKVLPEINDDFATTLTGNYVSKDLAELKEKVKAELKDQAAKDFKNSTVNSLLLQIRDNSEYVIGKPVLDYYVNNRINEQAHQIESQFGGMNLDEFLKLTNKTHEDFEKEIRVGVESEIKNNLVYESLMKELQIAQPSKEEVEKELGSTIDEVYNRYSAALKGSNLSTDEINSRINNYINQVYASVLTGKVQAKVLELNAPKPKAKKAKEETKEEKPAEEAEVKAEEKPAEEAK